MLTSSPDPEGPEPASGSFGALTYNVHGFSETLAGDGPEARMPQIRDLLGEDGSSAPALLKGTSDPERLGAIQVLTAFVEGYGDYLTRRAAADLLPDLVRIEEANARRRSEPDQTEQYLQQAVGLELKRHRAADAAAFCVEVEERWGTDALDRVWEQADYLPTLSELTDPVGWAARVLMDQFEI